MSLLPVQRFLGPFNWQTSPGVLFKAGFIHRLNCKIIYSVINQLTGLWQISVSIFRIFLLLILFACCVEAKIAFAFEGEFLTQEKMERLILHTANGPHEFKVEVMQTPEELEKGLMFRKYLPANRGMLFDFQVERPINMWMKNTYIPLDMIFMSRQGEVTSISENAEPLSEAVISSNGPVYAVLEVNGGTAAKIGLKIGDYVNSSLFKR